MSLVQNTSNYFKTLFFGGTQTPVAPTGNSPVPEQTTFDEQTYLKQQGLKEVLFSKNTFSRPDISGTNSRSKRTVYTIAIVVGILLLIMQQFALLFVIGSLVFIQIALSRTQPESISYEISNLGIMYGDKIYYWPKLLSFYFGIKDSQHYIGVNTENPFPGRLFLFFDEQDRPALDIVLADKLSKLDEEPRTFIDNAYKAVSDKFDI